MTGIASDIETAAFAKVTRRFVPFLFVCYIFNYLDRVNVGFAKLGMLGDLHMSESAYGFGAGIFFLGYVAFGVPSNLMAERVGARRWLAVLMVVWGLLSAGLMFVRSAAGFHVLRFLMGAAEAGFFPGIVLFLTRWFPAARRGRAMAAFMAAIPLSGVVGGPLSGWILARFAHGPHGLAAWQWLFLIEGLPTVLLGAGMWRLLEHRGARPAWLSAEEHEAIGRALAGQAAAPAGQGGAAGGEAAAWPAIAALGIVYFCVQAGVYAINFWLPTILAGGGLTPLAVGWLSAVPYLAAAACMAAVGRSADRRGERRWHLAGPMLLGAAGLLLAVARAGDLAWALAGLTLAAMGALAALPMFWPFAGRYLPAATAAAGLAVVNSLGQVAGFLSPFVVGGIKDATGSTGPALLLLTALLAAGSVVALRLRPPRRSASS